MLVLALIASNLYKTFKGKVKALQGLSLAIREGEVYGLVGPNGSGKTTALRIIATLLKPDSGKVQIFGIDALESPYQARKLLSYLPEEANVYERLTGWENLLFFARLFESNRERALEMAWYGATISGLGAEIHRRAGEYSKGMKRRLLLARALMVNPRVAILDEPTAGLDIFSSVKIREMIREHARARKTTVLLSSHNLFEVEKICDRVGFIYKGRLLEEGAPRELIEKYKVESLEEAFMSAIKSALH
uniref:ABC transporter ATP-binding protein n=1 Tax=Fervidicoccus fontis TaxID=683846 RepID=A0A7J3ZIF2_9CREN